MATGNIMLLESDRELLNARAKNLSREGYHITAIASIEKALEALAERSYELLILRPESSELLNMLLARFPADIAVLIMSKATTVSRVATSSGAGIHIFLIEPVTARKLRDTVARVLNSRQAIIESVREKALNVLGQARQLLSPTIDMDRYFRIVAEMSAAGTGADYTQLSIRDDSSKQWNIRARYGEAQAGWEQLCQETISQAEPVLICEEQSEYKEIYLQLVASGASSLMSMPLVIKGEVIGVIQNIRAVEKKPFTQNDMNFAAVLGWWSGTALENIRLFQKIEQQRQQVDNLILEVSHAQENERKRVAIEIHDGVAQWMVGATYGLKACAALISESRLEELQVELAKIGQTLQRSVRELRRTIANLRPLALEEGGLTTAIRQVVQPLIEEGINCRFQVNTELPDLTFPQETTIYWILQESLSNVRSHAGATEVDIQIECRDVQMTVTVNDNGKGFNPEKVLKSAIPLEHMGLLGMRERARLLGGNLTIESCVGKGTRVKFTFPLASLEPANAIV